MAMNSYDSYVADLTPFQPSMAIPPRADRLELEGDVDPNGVVTATGPAIFRGTTTEAGKVWVKVTEGTSNDEWTQLVSA